MLADFWQGARKQLVERGSFGASSNVEPAHNTTNYFAPTYSEVVNLTGLLKTKD
jgi:hypothetical protein